MDTTYDSRHRSVLEQLLLHGELSFEALQRKTGLREEFGLIMGDIAEHAGKQSALRPVEWRWKKETRFYRIKTAFLLKASAQAMG